jgi:GT2 family glycosyltransferase
LAAALTNPFLQDGVCIHGSIGYEGMTMVEKPRVAALLTCFNRRETTLACLRSLHAQTALGDVQLSIYLVDDGCTDGTGDAVRREFPQVTVLLGDGHRYWCGGMRLAWDEAVKGDYDHYLWLNDDTMLYPDALARVLATEELLREREGRDVIVAGTTRDPANGKSTYGGMVKDARVFIQFRLLEPGAVPMRCDTFCGNCVLVPASIARRVGNLSASFKHHLGDFDYGLRAAALGARAWVVAGHVGTCSAHDLEGSHLDATLPLDARVPLMRRPSGPPPIREWMVFMRRHSGWRWPLYWGRTLVRGAFPKLWLTVRSTRPQRPSASDAPPPFFR